jgi:RNA polymerase sigma-70 factor, ECF subfamily
MAEVQNALSSRSDEELMGEFQAGNRDAFNLLVGRFKDPLLNFAFRFLGDYDEADDVVQETFIRLYRNPAGYRPVARFSTWIYTIASNLAKSRLRQLRRHSIFSIHRKTDTDNGGTYDIPDQSNAPDESADTAIRGEMIQKALLQVKPKYREIIVLCDIQDLSYEEIRDVTGLSMGTVKSRLNRARNQLQKLLQDVAG